MIRDFSFLIAIYRFQEPRSQMCGSSPLKIIARASGSMGEAQRHRDTQSSRGRGVGITLRILITGTLIKESKDPKSRYLGLGCRNVG